MNLPHIDRKLGMLTYLHPGPGIGGRIRERLSDFIVDEVVMGIRASRALLGIDKLPSRGPYRYIVAAKFVKMDTRKLASLISRSYGCRIRYAGLKDARAVAFQFMSLEGRCRVRELRSRGLVVKLVGSLEEPLSRGRNDGNHFTIIVRGSSQPEELRDFPNFFSYQRFGSKEPFNHEVGRALLMRDLKSAEEMIQAQGYEVAGKSLRQLADHLDVGPLRFYIHAYQSYLFNLLLSLRIMEGLHPREGDLVIKANGEVALYPEEGDLALPIPGAYTRAKGWIAQALRRILREEGVSLDMFLFRELPEISALGGIRPALERARSLSLEARSSYIAMSFFLRSGAYATSYLREIMKPEDPVAQGFF